MKPFRFFDVAATTQCIELAASLVEEFATQTFGNPSSAHAMGRAALRAIDEAHETIAQLFDVEPDQVIFTGSGTEADNLAILGLHLPPRGRNAHVLCSSTEHAAVKMPVQHLKEYDIDTDLIPVNSEGQIDTETLKGLLRPITSLISIHQVNNVTGAILPVEAIARFVKSLRPEILFHSDCVQSFCKVAHPRASQSAIDLVSISAHKIGGPKGVGALVILNRDILKKNRLSPLLWGGGQECGFRPGSQNAGLIAGFSAAAKISFQKMESQKQSLLNLYSFFKSEIKRADLERFTWINSPEVESGLSVPHIINISIRGIPGPFMAQKLEESGFMVSTGSACSSKSAQPDSTLRAMGFSSSQAMNSIRISFNSSHSKDDIRDLVQAMSEVFLGLFPKI